MQIKKRVAHSTKEKGNSECFYLKGVVMRYFSCSLICLLSLALSPQQLLVVHDFICCSLFFLLILLIYLFSLFVCCSNVFFKLVCMFFLTSVYAFFISPLSCVSLFFFSFESLLMCYKGI